MLRWTSSFTIPLPPLPRAKNLDADCYGTVIGPNIWMMFVFTCERGHLVECMRVMNTETHKIHAVECIHEDFESTMFVGLTSDGSNMYMLRGKMAGVPREFISDFTIFVMDTTKQKLEWQKMREFQFHGFTGSWQVIKETVYLFGRYQLMVMDLTQKKPTSIVRLMVGRSARLIKNNDTLYIIAQDDTCRTVHTVENDGTLRIVKKSGGISEDNCIFDNGNKIFYNQNFVKTPVLESYDFVNNDWIRKKVESTVQNLRIKNAFEYNDKIYVIVMSDWHDRIHHELRVLALKPNLSDICWINVVDKLGPGYNKKQIQNIRNLLPDPLKAKMDSVVNWRIAEKEKVEDSEMHQLLEERFSRVIQEIYGMSYDEEICEEQEKQLINLFKRED